MLFVTIFRPGAYFQLKNPTMTALEKFFSSWKTNVATISTPITTTAMTDSIKNMYFFIFQISNSETNFMATINSIDIYCLHYYL